MNRRSDGQARARAARELRGTIDGDAVGPDDELERRPGGGRHGGGDDPFAVNRLLPGAGGTAAVEYGPEIAAVGRGATPRARCNQPVIAAAIAVKLRGELLRRGEAVPGRIGRRAAPR